MKKLSKKQRREIYLKVAENRLQGIGSPYLCCQLRDAIDEKETEVEERILPLFPEFMLFKNTNGVWFHHEWKHGYRANNPNDERINCMLFCAEMCKS